MSFTWENFFYNPYAIPHTLIGIFIMLEGIFIYKQNKRSITNFAYLINCFFPAVWLTGVGIFLSSRCPETALFWARNYCYLGIIFIPAAVYLFSLAWRYYLCRYSNYTQDYRMRDLFLERKSLIFVFSVSFLFYLFSVFSSNFLTGIWKYPWGFFPKGGIIHLLFIGWFSGVYFFAVKNFIASYKEADSVLKKKQAKLVLIAFSVAVIGASEFLPNYGFNLPSFASVTTLIFISLVGYCVIRYRLMNIETVLHKTVAWFIANLILVIPFVVALYFTYPWFSDLSQVNIFIFLAFLGIIFLFFVRSFHAKIDHFFQRRRYRLEEIANQFTEDLVHLKGVEALGARIKAIIKNTLYLQRVDFFIYDSKSDKFVSVEDKIKGRLELKIDSVFLQWLAESNRIIYQELIEMDPSYHLVKGYLKKYFESSQAAVIVPLVLGQELLGVVNLGKKATFKKYTALDFHFLNVLKNQSAIAISNSLLYDDMEAQVRKRTEELVDIQKQLIQAEKMATVGTLAGGVAHEINNPLTAILTNVQFLLKFPDSVDTESLKLMEEATQRCRTIIQKLMLYARKPSESGETQKINILNTVNGVVGLLGYQFSQDNLKINIKAAKEKYLVDASANEIEQVITNLLLNAKDAIKKVKNQGVIEIEILENFDSIKLKIKDEGAGISKEDLTKIFDPFFTTKEVGKGTGLGLSICQSIIEKHKGSIQIKSELKKGTVFTVVLPKVKE